MRTFFDLQKWFKLSTPKASYLIGSFIFGLLWLLGNIFGYLCASKVIDSLNRYSFNASISFLIAGFISFALVYLSSHYILKLHLLQSKHINTLLNNKLYAKFWQCNPTDIHNNSIEKFLSIFTLNIKAVDEFSYPFVLCTINIVTSLVSITIVAIVLPIIAVILLSVSLVLFLWYFAIGKIQQSQSKKIYINRDELGETLTDIIKGRYVSDKLNLINKNHELYLTKVKNINKINSNKQWINNLSSELTNCLLTVLLSALIYMVMVKTINSQITLFSFLIVIPIVKNCITSIQFANKLFFSLEKATVSAHRISTILNMSNQDFVSYSNNATDALSKNLIFTNVSYQSQPNLKDQPTYNIETFNAIIKPNTITMFKGVKNCGKKHIFNLLARNITPTTGTITMDGINIYDFSKQIYKHNFSYVENTPMFYSESIIENLRYANAIISKKQIVAILKKINIYNNLQTLSKGLHTNMTEQKHEFSAYTFFMLGLARCILSSSEWICIYEFPTTLTQTEKQNIIKTIKLIKQKSSVIIFTASDFADSICTKIYQISQGQLQK